jgi:predicted unusual protein kinase regulating ubiquinone biosynthesis (AarF/ABC1/UbiB family)
VTRRLERLATGLRGRTLKTARLASKIGMTYAKRALGAAPELSPAQREKAVARAEQLVEELGALKGLVMKVGQIASYMPGAMSPEAQRVLARLQARTAAMVFERVDEVVRSELGAGPDERFDRFEREPFAAASIGQVHRAEVGGRPVAVKVQYPGIEEVLRSDLRTVGALARMSAIGTDMDGAAIVEELRDRILEECDYLKEAESQTLFRALWSDGSGRRVPEVIGSHTSRRVLTTELVVATDFQTFAEEAPQAAKDRAAATLFRTCFQTVFQRCVYNADPHPGNYLFDPDGTVTFLDFGCVRRFDPAMIDRWKRTARAVVDGDRAAFEPSYVELGFVLDPKRFDWDHQWEVMQYLYKPFTSREPFTYDHDYVRKSYGLMLFDNPNKKRTAMPPEWLFLNRLQWGLNSVLAALGATGPWRELWREAIDSPTLPAGNATGRPGVRPHDAHLPA